MKENMKVYNFKCESCGSKQYTKTKDGYKCEYCGSFQDVIMPTSEEQTKSQEQQTERFEPVYHESKTISPEQKSILIRLIICFFVGVFGVHRFVEGKIFTGILYLITWGLFGFGVFIDVIRYIIALVRVSNRHGG